MYLILHLRGLIKCKSQHLGNTSQSGHRAIVNQNGNALGICIRPIKTYQFCSGPVDGGGGTPVACSALHVCMSVMDAAGGDEELCAVMRGLWVMWQQPDSACGSLRPHVTVRDWWRLPALKLKSSPVPAPLQESHMTLFLFCIVLPDIIAPNQ